MTVLYLLANVGFPLPGNYPGEGYHWPANSNWRSDKDGKVHYPLTLRKLIVELPQKVLHVKSWAPPPRAEIYLSDLTVAQGAGIAIVIGAVALVVGRNHAVPAALEA